MSDTADVMRLHERAGLRPKEAAAYIGVSRKQVDRWTADARQGKGDFPLPIRLGKQIIVYRRQDLDEWLKSQDPDR